MAAQVLKSQGLTLDRARKIVSKGWKTAGAEHDIVEIHGEAWDGSYVRAQVDQLRKFAWCKRSWQPLDVLVEIEGGRIFFDLRRKGDSGFKLVTGGWPRDSCTLCEWELSVDGGPEHAAGYPNGREWLCTECYEKLLGPSDKESE